MGTETRIGIATGLVIVVVASIYFFYGSERPEDQLLLATGSATTSPKIPKIEESKSKPATKGRAFKPVVGKTVFPLDGKIANGQSARRGVPAPSPSTALESSAPSPSTIQVPVKPKVIQIQPAVASSAPALRSSASSELVDATRANLGIPSDRAEKPLELTSTPTPRLVETGRTDGDLIDTENPSGQARSTSGATPPSFAPTRSEESSNSQSTQLVMNLPKPAESWTAVGANTPIQLAKSDPAVDEPVAPRSTPSSSYSSSRSLPPASPLIPSETWPRKHTIQNGDTLVAVSDQYYGTPLHAQDILRSNPQIKSAKALKIGDVIALPAPTNFQSVSKPAASIKTHEPMQTARSIETKASTPSVSSMTSYQVQPGDTFYSVAAKKLGDSRRWKELYELNRKVVKDNAKNLRPGMTISVPK